jgi:hypothetical protein
MAAPNRTSPPKAASPQGKAAAPARTPAGSKAGAVKGASPAARQSASSAADAVAKLKGVGSSNVARYLADKGAPALIKGVGALQKLRKNEQTHDDAGKKLNQSEKAVEIPKSEEQSKSNAGQVDMVDARPKPTADDAKAKGGLQNTLAANVPRKIEDVDNFKSNQKAQIMGADVMTIVQGDKAAVTSTFQDMGTTPPPIPTDHKTETLPPQEAAPPTAVMNLGQGAVAPLQKEHTDVSNFTNEADSKLKEEGVTQEQLDMVDSGDLATANKEKKGMEKMAKDEPLAIQNFAKQETAKVDKDLKQEEKAEREGMRAKRRAALGATATKQKGTKTALEKKREDVASKINGIYKAAQDNVKKKLADLETLSMKRFDTGNAAATKEFEDTVNREFDAFKDDRYSGFGRLNKIRDWVLGMDDLPEVKAIFDRNRAIFVKTINKLVEDITADNKRVIQECKDELAKARKDIKDFVDKLEPGLKDIGKKSAEAMDAKLDEMDGFVAKKEQELQDKLKDKQQAAIKAIDEKIEKMKEAMSGALAKLGKLLLLAAKKFFSWALEKAGFSLSDIEGIINKGVAVLKAIFTKPIQFVKNLINAASTGFKNFGKNFLKHLKDAVFEWLTGSLDGVTLPQNWDLKGILSLIFQLVGLTYQNIRSHLVKLIPEPVVKTLETGFTLVKTLITEGPMAAWEQLKEMAGEMKEAFIEAVKDWIKWKVVEEAIKTVLAIFIPGAGIIKAIIAIYDTVVFFIQKAKEILKMVGNFLSSISDIAAGNIGAAATALEEGLARALKLVIDFLARFLRLTGITNAIKKTIQKVRGKVDNVIEKVAKWIVAQARKLGRFVAQAGVPQDPNERLRLASQAAVSAARRLTGRITQGLLNPILQGIKIRYGLQHLQPYEQGGSWWVRATINPTVTQNLGVPADAAPLDGPQRIELSVNMNGASHRLIIITGAQRAVKMASAENFLAARIGRMLGSVRGELARERAKGSAANPTRITKLEGQTTDLEAMRLQAQAAEDAAAVAGIRAPLSPPDPAFLTLRAQLQAFAVRWDRTDIAEYIIPPELPEPTPAEVAADPDIAARRAWCRSVNINNPDSDTAMGLYRSRNDEIQSLIGAGVLVASVARALPGPALTNTVDWALRIGRFEGVNVRKFVTDQRDKFRGR